MSSFNSYVAYKRDTKNLLQWIIGESNTIIFAGSTKFDVGDEPKTPNTTGQTTVAGLVSMTRLIAKYSTNSTPASILALLLSVIKARTTSWEAYQESSAFNPDPELVAYNKTHKYFIDSLQEISGILGAHADKFNNDAQPSGSTPAEPEDLVLKNKFDLLQVSAPQGAEGEADDSGSADEGHDQESQPSISTRRRQPRPGRGKKGKGAKKNKKKKVAAQPKEPSLEEIPLESFKIIEDTEGIVTDYLLAVYALFEEVVKIRLHLQRLWKEVAYNGLNSAVVGAVSQLGVAMIQRAEFAMLLDFPGHDSYETVMNTITRGDPDKFQGNLTLKKVRIRGGRQDPSGEREAPLDLKESFLIYTYRALLDFVVDFQKTRSGTPTRAMMKEIRNWDPLFDLQKATEAQRLAWRRSFTINWLYDLVNVFSSVVVQRNRTKGQHWRYETVDWSPRGPWDRHRRLFGLNEFAGVITSLAMQKPNTDVRSRILPHHVFHLQCIVDSLTISRGWYISLMEGHVLQPPPRGFRPRRDVDRFLDRQQLDPGRGYLQGVDVLGEVFDRDAKLHGDPRRHRDDLEVIKLIQDDFINWLGESKYMYGLNTIPPSRFTDTNANGLWEYSPFLCGVGLMEGLELAYGSSLSMWDHIPEPHLCVHLHNMLVQKGHIEKQVGLYGALQSLFARDFFVNGVAPTSGFHEALKEALDQSNNRSYKLQTARARQEAAQTNDLHKLFGTDNNHFFKTKSNLLLYRPAYWNPERIPDSDLRPSSYLGLARIGQTKKVLDPATGKMRFADTELIRRAKKEGASEEGLVKMLSVLRRVQLSDKQDFLSATRDMEMPEGFTFRPGAETATNVSGASPAEKDSRITYSNVDLLHLIQNDILADVCGALPLSSFNYIWMTNIFFLWFGSVEDDLRKTRNPLWVRAYETDSMWASQKRVGLAFLAMAEEDEECLQVMAKHFQYPKLGLLNYVYWGELMTEASMNKETSQWTEKEPDCTVM